MCLSGTRTGSMVAETEQLARFVGLLGVPKDLFWFFDGIEAILVFMTVEVCLFVSGYLYDSERVTDKKWYFYLMITAIVPALVSNIGPAFRLLGENVFSIWLVVVTVIVGLATLTMALIAGRVLSVYENDYRQKKSDALKLWQEKQRAAWIRSPQYKELRGLNVKVLEIEEKDLTQQLLELIENSQESSNVRDLAKSVSLPQRKVMLELKSLQQKGLVEINGLNVLGKGTLIDKIQ